MPRVPRVFGLVLCDRLELNPQTRQWILVGVFHVKALGGFPSSEQAFTVYSALYGASGTGILELEIVRHETEEVVYRYSKETAFPGKGIISNLEIPVRKCIFPAPGQLQRQASVSRRRIVVPAF